MGEPVNHLRHEALVYESDEQYADTCASFLLAGADAGEAAVVAATRDRLAVIREALGPAAGRVAFVDVGSMYVRPARTIAAYHTTLVEHLQSAPSVRVVAEVQFGPTPAEWDEWAAYEAITNHAYADLAAWVVCTYDARRLPDRVLDVAWQAHPRVLTDEWRHSDRFDDHLQLVHALNGQPEPLPGLRSLAPGGDAQALRERLARELAREGVSEDKALDMLVAASEIATNAWQHAGGPVELRAGRVDGRFVCEISDRGPGLDDPLAGYSPPKPGQEGGAGLWIARQLAWRLDLLSSPAGLTARLWL